MDYLARLESNSKEHEHVEKLMKKKLRLQQQLQTLERELADNSVDSPLKQKHVQEFSEIMDAYKLLGVSTQIKGENLFLRFDPAYRNVSKPSSYYCLEIKGNQHTQTVGQHNLPPFIPIKNLEDEFLANGNLEEFVEHIQTYLYAYTQRREGIKNVKTDFSSKGIVKVETDLPVVFVCVVVSLNKDWPDISVTLNYNLSKDTPSSVNIDKDDSVEISTRDKDKLTKIITRWKPQLIHQDIYTAFSNLLNGLE